MAERRAIMVDLGKHLCGRRLFVHMRIDPYALVTPVTRIVREMSVDQPVEHAATLEDIRAEVLASIGMTAPEVSPPGMRNPMSQRRCLCGSYSFNLAALRVSDFLQPSRHCEPQIDFCRGD